MPWRIPSKASAAPWTPGGESAGIVTKIGDGVTDIEPGDRVMMLGGGLIERVNVRSTGVWKIPDNFAFEKAAAVPVNYGTTWFALHQRGNIQSGETVLVTGAAGGTGSAAIQLAKATGAMVIAVAGGAEKTKQAEFLGADHVIDHQIKGDWVDEVRELSNGGVDIAYDPVGGDTTHQVRRCMAGWSTSHYWVCCWDTRLTCQSYASQKLQRRWCPLGGFLRKRSAVTEQSNAFNH